MDERTIEGVVESCKLIKSGTKGGRQWTLYKVMINGVEFNSWSDWSSTVGTDGVFTYSVKNREYNGATFETWVLDKPPRRGTLSSTHTTQTEPSSEGNNYQDVMNVLARLEAKIDRLLTFDGEV